MLVYIALVCVFLGVAARPRAGAAGAWPEAGVGNVPVTVDKLVIAFDGWGGDVLNPWQYLGTGLLQSYLNLRLMHRDENMQVVPLWATEWQQTPEGIFLTLDPKAKWQDGTPATAEDLRANIEALMGQYAPAFKGTPRMAYMKKVVEEVQVIDATHVERVDTAVLQMLCAFVRDAQASGIVVQWRQSSPALENAARLLNVRACLALPMA